MKIKKVKYFLCLLFLSFNHIVSQEVPPQAKHTISGYINEFGSKESLPAVSIYIPKLQKGTTTNDYGFFSLTIPAGTYEVFVSYIGYKTIKQVINLNDDFKLNLDLEPGVESLDEVIIDGNKGVNESEITQMSVVSIKPAEIKELPAILGEKDVLKSLQLLPGIQGGTEGTSGFYVRGGTPDQNLIILDEAPVYNANHLFGIFSVFNGDAIKSIETFKGGFPARFGGRLSSVLKIDMKNGNKERFTGKFNIGLISSSLLLEGPIKKGKTSFIFSGRRTYLDLLTLPFQQSSFKSGYYFTDFNFKIHHVINEKNKLYWSNFYGKDNFYINDNFSPNDRFKSRLGWGNISSTLRWNHQFSNKFFANTSLIFSNYKFEVFSIDTFNGETNKYNINSGINDYGLKVDFNYYPSTNHSIRFGAHSTFHEFTPKQSKIEETGQNTISTNQILESFESAVYFEDDWKITNKLSLSPGIRFSHFQYEKLNYFKPEPRLAMSWNLKPDLAIKSSYSIMNQYVHLLSNSGIGLPTDLWVTSTDKIKPQISEQIALGLAKDFLEEGYAFTLEGYYKKMDNVISYKEGASFLVLDNLESDEEIDWEENITSGQGWAYGTEVLFRKKTGKFTGWLGYTLSWSERQFDLINQGKKFFARYDRRHDISLVGIYKPNEKITFSSTWVLSSGNNFNLPDKVALSNTNNFPISVNSEFNPFGSLSGITSAFNTERNNFRGETFHKLDLAVQFHKKFSKTRERTWGFSVYNAYNRKNPFYYYFNDDDRFTKVSVLQLIPSFNYTYKF